MESIQITKIKSQNERLTTDDQIKKFGYANSKKIHKYHSSFPEYERTPLVCLKNLAKEFDVNNIYIKDESLRFGLNAFKVLGGSYCLAKYIEERFHLENEELTYKLFKDDNIISKCKDLVFATATDGNHGRGIAWTAQKLGVKCVVSLPKGSSEERLENIRSLGAIANISNANYDQTVENIFKESQKNGWITVQDTSWENYETFPTWIMQGYTTMGYEIIDQLEKLKSEKLTHIFLQAGVGAMSGAIAAFFVDYYKDQDWKPIIVIVEPNRADCLYQTALANDGTLHTISGNMDTIMAGLACGKPCSIGWNILHDYADYFVSIQDEIAASGMRILSNPLKDDDKIVSGESGAASFGFLMEVLRYERNSGYRDKLRIDQNSNILCISTEGNTDKEIYKKIVWDGYFGR